MTGYIELQTTSNFSFLRGASHIEELFARAAELGYPALALTDRNTLAGIPRAHLRAREAGVRLIAGCRLDLRDGAGVLVYPTDRAAWGGLCRLLSLGKARAGKGGCDLEWEDLATHAQGLIAILCDGIDPVRLDHLRACFADRAHAALTPHRRANEAVRLRRIADWAAAARVAPVVTGDVLYHHPERRVLQDTLTCIRLGRVIDDLGFQRERSVNRELRPPAEMARLMARHPEALERAGALADQCRFSLDSLHYQYPREDRLPGLTPQQSLEHLTWEGAAQRYGGVIPDAVRRQLNHELDLIGALDYAPYFLTVHSIVRFARGRGILCQGRGSAANSAVCYVLGITAIDPTRSGLLFERFISAERREPPDIDVDFEHERREEVIQWIFETYGRDRAALAATVIRYRARGAVRDVGKALGLPEDVTAALAARLSHWREEEVTDTDIAALNLNPADRRLRLTLALARTLLGFPRHLSQHPGGFVLTEERLDELVPVEPARMADRQVIEWDKDDIAELRFMKVDVLGLGMLGCLRRALDLLGRHHGRVLEMADILPEDAPTYAMIQKADTLGTFQIESRAQMSMLPRLKPRTFYDLVIQVAIVRPGPIQGDMVHPYLRRREGLEPALYPTAELRRVLEKTLGVPLFQEQAMQVAIVCAGFTPGEADQLRRSMATFKFTGGVHHFRDKMITGMLARGYTEAFAAETFSRIEGFGSYGFPESHAASFALIAYASSWLKCHYPDVFCCALLNAQPMGFYAPAQIVRDAQLHGVTIRPVCVNASGWDCALEPDGSGFAVRLGLRMVRGLARQEAEVLISRRAGGYASIAELWRRVGVSRATLERLAEADAFQALGLDRRQAGWAIKGLPATGLPLFDVPALMAEPAVALTPLLAGREVVEDYRAAGLSLRRHPVSFLRPDLDARRITRCADLVQARDGRKLTVAGIVLVRQRPGSARGVLFVTIEDETGHANLIVWPALFERARGVLLSATMLSCAGRVQREGEVIHVIADGVSDLSALLRDVERRDAEGAEGGEAAERRGFRVPTRDFR